MLALINQRLIPPRSISSVKPLHSSLVDVEAGLNLDGIIRPEGQTCLNKAETSHNAHYNGATQFHLNN